MAARGSGWTDNPLRTIQLVAAGLVVFAVFHAAVLVALVSVGAFLLGRFDERLGDLERVLDGVSVGRMDQRMRETEVALKRLDVKVNRIRTQGEVLLDRGNRKGTENDQPGEE